MQQEKEKDKEQNKTYDSSRQFRNIELVQQIKYLPYSIEELKEKLEHIDYIEDYAYIIHDKDKGVEPHIHCMLLIVMVFL